MKKILAVLAFVIITSFQVFAGEVQEPRKGFFSKPEHRLEIGVAMADGWSHRILQESVDQHYKSAVGEAIKLGYRVTEGITVEVSYHNLSSFRDSLSQDYSNGVSINDLIQSDIQTVIADLKIGVPIRTVGVNWYPYILGGAGRVRYQYDYHSKCSRTITGAILVERTKKETQYGNLWRVGGGMEIKFRKNIWLYLQVAYQQFRVADMLGIQPADAEYMSGESGLLLRFF